jgi:hypothetical protein
LTATAPAISGACRSSGRTALGRRGERAPRGPALKRAFVLVPVRLARALARTVMVARSEPVYFSWVPLLTAEHRQFNIALAYGLSASQKALGLSNRYSDAMNDRTQATDAMSDQTRTDRARRGKLSWRIASASVAFAATQANEWHRWYAWHPVICDNAPGGVVWGLTVLRRRERGGWVYRMGLRNRRL